MEAGALPPAPPLTLQEVAARPPGVVIAQHKLTGGKQSGGQVAQQQSLRTPRGAGSPRAQPPSLSLPALFTHL